MNKIDKLIDADELVRSFIQADEHRYFANIYAQYQLVQQYYTSRQSIIQDQYREFYTLTENTTLENTTLDNQIALINGIKSYNFLSDIFAKQGYTLNLFGGWLVRVLAGLDVVHSDIDIYVVPPISKSETIQIFDKYLVNSGFGIKEYSLIVDSDNNYRKFAGSNDIDCYRLQFSSGIVCDFLTNKPDESCVDFNLNQLVFTPNGINRRVEHGNGTDWGSIFLGLYTRSCVSVKKYDQTVSMDSLEGAFERYHTLQMFQRYLKMKSKGLRITNFNPPIKPGELIKIGCGHIYQLDQLKSYVSRPDSTHCTSCQKPIEIIIDSNWWNIPH